MFDKARSGASSIWNSAPSFFGYGSHRTENDFSVSLSEPSEIAKDFLFLQLSKNVLRSEGVRGFYAGYKPYTGGLSMYIMLVAFFNEKISVLYDKHLLGVGKSTTNKLENKFNFFGNKKPTDAESPDNSDKPKFRR